MFFSQKSLKYWDPLFFRGKFKTPYFFVRKFDTPINNVHPLTPPYFFPKKTPSPLIFFQNKPWKGYFGRDHLTERGRKDFFSGKNKGAQTFLTKKGGEDFWHIFPKTWPNFWGNLTLNFTIIVIDEIVDVNRTLSLLIKPGWASFSKINHSKGNG